MKSTPGLALLTSFAHGGEGWDIAFAKPRQTLKATRPGEVRPLLDAVGRATARGLYAVLAVAYEAAPAFDPAFLTLPPAPSLPLAWAAIYDAPLPRLIPEPHAPKPAGEPLRGFSAGPLWQPLTDRAAYGAAVARAREWIRQGEFYQVNYTFPLSGEPGGDPLELFRELGRRQGAGYSAYIDCGDFRLLSFSPELFFASDGSRVTVRPMKGTLPRSGDPGEDLALRERLACCPKNRAENVMIVDLLRSDLGRIARPGTVEVERLFTVEGYRTVWQMTSTVTAALKPGTSLADIFAALFPCGSVTGAPRIRAMQAVAELERHPRGFYCGALGVVSPDGGCVFSVPIRTMTQDRPSGTATFGVGGGITHDSTVGDEYAECLAKASFLGRIAPSPGLIETIGIRGGRPLLLREHLERLKASAEALGYPCDIGEAAKDIMARAGMVGPGLNKLRLVLNASGCMELTCAPLSLGPRRVLRVGLAATPVLASAPLLRHKTTDRARFDRAQAERPDLDDMLLVNERGEITESCRANVVIRDARGLWTPPASSGLLPGCFRRRLLERGIVRERVVTPGDIEVAEGFWLVNSVRGWMRATLTRTGAAG